MSEQVKFHVVHDRVDNPGRFVIAREGEDVRYWSDEWGAWIFHPGGTRYPSKHKAERRLGEIKDKQ